jgi:hypothetical protein
MTVAYAPFEENPPVIPPRKVELPKNAVIPVPEGTECNYLVMFFVAGVFVIALMDSMRS